MASSRDLRANSSVGLGGIVPPGRMWRLADRSEDCIMLRRSVLCGATRYWVMPRSLCEIWNTLFNPGLRISSPTMTTFLPNSAKLTARLEAMKVFPSPLVVEVTRITFLSGSPNMKSRLVRRLRKVSAMMSLSFSRTAMAYFSSESFKGTSPITGTRVSLSTSECPSMR